MENYRGIDYLRIKLNKHSRRIRLRYKQYDMKKVDISPGITIPIALRAQYNSVLGWCTKSVDNLADRLIFREFSNDNFKINEIFSMNNPDVFFDSAVLSALIASCCFVYISDDGTGYPRLQIIEADKATGVIDPITGLLSEGYAVLQTDQYSKPVIEAYFTPEYTEIFKNGVSDKKIDNPTPYPLLVPIIHRPDAVRPFGRSRISRASMDIQKKAKRTLERAEVSAEFYSFPQKYVVGTSPTADPFETWKATISSMLEFTKDEDGDSPKLGQFTQQSMSPYTEQLRMNASLFSGETGLSLDDLGFVSDNPSSAEAIKASHENLRMMARKAQRTFGSGFLNVGYLAVCMRDKQTYERKEFYKTKAKWEPIFEPDATTFGLIGDAASKINIAVPGFIDEEILRDHLGLGGKKDE
ncbi:phage portal protein [Erysipelothrix aquatica]